MSDLMNPYRTEKDFKKEKKGNYRREVAEGGLIPYSVGLRIEQKDRASAERLERRQIKE